MTGSVRLGGGEFSVSEVDGTILVPIIRTGDLSGAVNIQYSIAQDTADAGVDYTGTGGTVTMPVGVDRVFVPVDIVNDGESEDTETFVVTIITIDSGTLLAPRTARVNILDDENPAPDPVDPPLVADYAVSREELIDDLTFPMSLEFSPIDPNLVYIPSRLGTIEIHDITTGEHVSQFIDITDRVNSAGGRGIQDIALHPNFPSTPYVYAFYNVDPPDTAGKSGNAGPDGTGNRFNYLVRLEADPATNYQTAKPGSEVVLLGGGAQSLTDISGNGVVASVNDFDQPESGYDPDTGEYTQDFIKEDSSGHSGGSLAFGPDGYLYVSTGDGTSFNFADPRTVSVQSIDSLNGKILRIDPITGLGLPDNPFVEDGDPLDTNRAKVYQLGLRNPFSMGFDENGELYITDTGWFTWEEINRGEPGANFGWPFYEGGDNGSIFETPGGYANLPEADAFYDAVEAGTIDITAPFRAFHHANSVPGFQFQAITGGDVVYTGDKYPEDFQNHYFFSDYSDGEVFAIDVNDRRDVKYLFTFATGFGPIQYTQGPDGYVYFVDIARSTIERLLIEEGDSIPDGSTLRLEAEDFSLNGYEVESTGASSGNQHVRNITGQDTAVATETFNGPAGEYQLKIAYYDEDDGVATLAVEINGEEIWRFDLDEQLPSPFATPATHTTRTLSTTIELNPGDEIRVLGTNQSGEQSRVDYLDLMPVATPPPDPEDNQDPEPQDDVSATPQNVPLRIGLDALLDNDEDPDGDTLSLLSFGNGALGTVALDGTDLVFSPILDAVGLGGFDYTVTDGRGGSGTARVNVAIGASYNAPPDPSDDTASTDEDVAVRIPIADLLLNDNDPDDDVLTLISVDNPVLGSVEIDGTDVVFTPAPGEFGLGGFDYTVSDGRGGIASASVGVDIAEVDDPPPPPPPPPPPTGDPIRLEAEGFDAIPGGNLVAAIGVASEGLVQQVKYVSQGGPGEGTPVTTTTAYSGPSGTFNLFFGGFDESDGDSRIVVEIDGWEVADFVLNQDPGGSGPDASSQVRREVATGIDVSDGDQIAVTIYRDGGEYTRFDYLELVPLGPPTGPVGPVTDTDGAPNTIAEDAAADDAAGITALASDPDAGDTVTYAIDDPRFQVGAGGHVTVAPGAVFDAETEPTVPVTVTATSSDGSTSSEDFTIQIADVNEVPVGAPTDTDGAANTLSESAPAGTPVGLTAFAEDGDVSDSVSYSIDDPRFTIDAGGIVRLSGTGSLDAAGEPTVTVQVTATSSDGSTAAAPFQIAVSAAPPPPPPPPPPVDPIRLEAEGFESIPGGNQVAGIPVASEGLVQQIKYKSQGGPDSGQPTTTSTAYDGPSGTFALFFGGFDESDGNSRVVIGIEGQEVADFLLNQSPGGSGPDASTAVRREVASDVALNDGDEIAVTIYRDSGEYVRFDYLDLVPSGPPTGPVGPVSDADGGPNTIAEDAVAGTAVGITGLAQDPDAGDSVSYGIDDARFTIDGAGVVRVAGGAGFDAESEPVITVKVTANSTDGSSSDAGFAIQVTDVNEAPVGGVSDTDGAANTLSESAGAGTPVGITAFAQDPDISDSVTYGIDDPRFTVDADGTVRVSGSGSFDAGSEPSVEVEITATSTDASTASQSFTIDVTDAPPPPQTYTPVSLEAGPALEGGGARPWGDHATVSAFEYDGSPGQVFHNADGIGVDGGRFDMQIDWDGASQSSEALVLAFANGARDITLELGRMNPSEFSGQPETGRWEAYGESGGLLGSGRIDPGDGTSLGGGIYEIEVAYAGLIHELRIEATGYGNGAFATKTGDNSDFSLRGLDFEVPDDPFVV